jgi:hypothetical protein
MDDLRPEYDLTKLKRAERTPHWLRRRRELAAKTPPRLPDQGDAQASSPGPGVRQELGEGTQEGAAGEPAAKDDPLQTLTDNAVKDVMAEWYGELA